MVLKAHVSVCDMSQGQAPLEAVCADMGFTSSKSHFCGFM